MLAGEEEDPHAQWQAVRWRLLFIQSMVCMLGPLTGTLITPALSPIQEEFDATDLEISVFLGAYSGVFGVFTLLWGPISDRYSRKWSLVVALAGYFTIAYGMAWAPSIWVLTATRASLAAFASAFFIVTVGVISDTFYRHERGVAIGLRGLPPMVATMLGPPGGGLLAYLNWRLCPALSSFVALICFMLVLYGLPETLDKKVARTRPFDITAPLRLIVLPTIFFPALLQAMSLGTMVLCNIIVSLTFTKFYHTNTLVIGLCLIPGGVGNAIGGVIGGKMADRGSLAFGRGGRLAITVVAPLFGFLFTVLFGWTIAVHIAIPTTVLFFIGLFDSMVNPAVISFCIEEKPKNAAAVNSGIASLTFVALFLSQVVVIPLAGNYGYGPVLSAVAALQVLAVLPVAVRVYQTWGEVSPLALAKAKGSIQSAPAPPEPPREIPHSTEYGADKFTPDAPLVKGRREPA